MGFTISSDFVWSLAAYLFLIMQWDCFESCVMCTPWFAMNVLGKQQNAGGEESKTLSRWTTNDVVKTAQKTLVSRLLIPFLRISRLLLFLLSPFQRKERPNHTIYLIWKIVMIYFWQVFRMLWNWKENSAGASKLKPDLLKLKSGKVYLYKQINGEKTYVIYYSSNMHYACENSIFYVCF